MAGKKKSGSEKRERRALVGFRATPGEVQEIDEAADRAGLTRSAFVRAQCLAAPKMRATRRPTVAAKVLAQLLGQLGKVGGNLNQIAIKHNKGDYVTPATILAALHELHEVRFEIMKALGRKAEP